MNPETFRTHAYCRKRFDAAARRLALRARTVQEWKTWRQALRAELRKISGYNTMRRCPLQPKVTAETGCGGYRRERVEIQTEPGIVMPLYVLVPAAGQGPFPVVLAPHGHCGGGKAAVAGLRANPRVAAAIDEYNYDYGVQFARAGCVVFCPDARGFGERREKSEAANFMSASCRNINNMAMPLGQTVTGMWAWDLHRLLDYAATRPDCRPDRIGCAGLSGGGLQTLWAAALDDRIKAAVVSGYFYGYREALLDNYQNCSCNYVPHLWETADMGDIAGLIAPRALLVETGARDPLNGAGGLKNVMSQLKIARAAYRLFKAEGNLAHDVFEAGHRWHGVISVPWLVRQLS